MLHTNILTGYVTKSGIHSGFLYFIKPPKLILRMKAIFPKQYETNSVLLKAMHRKMWAH